MSGLPPMPGDPAAVRLLADRLTSTAQRLGALAGVLARLRDGATWDGPAGDAFAARLHEVPTVLDAVAVRLAGTAAPLRALAAEMAQAQAVVAVAVRDDDDAEYAYAVLEDRVYDLVGGGAHEDTPDVRHLRLLQQEQVEVQATARSRHAAASERFRQADERCARALRTLSLDAVTDPLPYRLLAGLSTVGHDVATLGAAAVAVPELRPVALVGDTVAVAADAGLLLAYGEGSWAALALGSGLAATGAAGGVLRSGATAGARRTAAGVVATQRLTAQQRLALGAVAEARRRRDRLRAMFATTPDRATPSASVGGPAPRVRAPSVPGATGLPRLRTAVESGVARSRAVARAQVDRAFLDDWRLATANGTGAQRMYASGATLEVATRATSSVADSTVADDPVADEREANVVGTERPAR